MLAPARAARITKALITLEQLQFVMTNDQGPDTFLQDAHLKSQLDVVARVVQVASPQQVGQEPRHSTL